MTSLQLLVAVLCGLIVFVDGFDAQAMGYVAPALTAALHIPRTVLGPVISAGLFGMMIGALACGSIADRIGRKPVLVGCALVFGIGSLLTATASSVSMLAAFRFFTGLGMGGAMPNAIALTSEHMPDRFRASAVTFMICGFSFGAAVGGWVAAALIGTYGWPSVFVVGGILPCVMAVVALVWLPESLRSAEKTRRASVPQLFTDRRGPGTALIWTIYFMNLLNLYLLNNWLPTIMNDLGIKVETAIIVTSFFQFGGIAGALVLGKILDSYRSFLVLAVCFLWAATWTFFIGWSGISVTLLLLTVSCAGAGVVGGQSAGHALTAEFYPSAIRGTGLGWALGIGRIGSIAGPIIGGYVLAQGGGATHVFWVAAIPALIAMTAAIGLGLSQPRSVVTKPTKKNYSVS